MNLEEDQKKEIKTMSINFVTVKRGEGQNRTHTKAVLLQQTSLNSLRITKVQHLVQQLICHYKIVSDTFLYDLSEIFLQNLCHRSEKKMVVCWYVDSKFK
jgi:hypothetical protein